MNIGQAAKKAFVALAEPKAPSCNPTRLGDRLPGGAKTDVVSGVAETVKNKL